MTFTQQGESQKLIQMLARIDIPNEAVAGDDAVLQAIEDAAMLYGLIEDARAILKMRGTQ